MSNSIYEECVTIVEEEFSDYIYSCMAEDPDHINEWKESYIKACNCVINSLAEKVDSITNEENEKKYLIIQCRPLSDQWDCDCDRLPICMTHNWKLYINRFDYIEVWELKDNGEFELIKNWDN